MLIMIVAVYIYLDRAKPPKIYIKVDEQGILYVQSEQVAMDSLVFAIEKIKQEYNQREQEKFIVHLTTSETISASQLAYIKQALRKVEALRFQHQEQ